MRWDWRAIWASVMACPLCTTVVEPYQNRTTTVVPLARLRLRSDQRLDLRRAPEPDDQGAGVGATPGSRSAARLRTRRPANGNCAGEEGCEVPRQVRFRSSRRARSA